MKYTWGDSAIHKTTNKACAVAGITPVDTEEQSKHFKAAVGSVLYTVEFTDGTDLLVPEDRLERML